MNSVAFRTVGEPSFALLRRRIADRRGHAFKLVVAIGLEAVEKPQDDAEQTVHEEAIVRAEDCYIKNLSRNWGIELLSC